MNWHHHWRARTAARTLANHRKMLEREPIRAKARDMAIRQGMTEQAELLRG